MLTTNLVIRHEIAAPQRRAVGLPQGSILRSRSLLEVSLNFSYTQQLQHRSYYRCLRPDFLRAQKSIVQMIGNRVAVEA